MDPDRHSVDAARRAAEDGQLDEWVAEFLASEGSDNAELCEQLEHRVQHWTGPVKVQLDQLKRLAGPPGDPVVVEVDDDYWDERVADLADKIDHGMEPPPLIVRVADDGLHLEDGNHRVEGLRRSGATDAWAVVGAATDQHMQRFLSKHTVPLDPPGSVADHGAV